MTKAQEKAAAAAAKKAAAWKAKVQTLLGHILTPRLDGAAMDRAFQDGQTAEAYAAEIAAREPVGQAVHGAKVDAIADAAERARKMVSKVRDDMIAHGWDREAAAPYPARNVPRRDEALGKYKLAIALTKVDPARGYQSGRGPVFVIMNDEGIARFVQEAERAAAVQYDAFIVKLVGKVGPAVSAVLTGSHVWGESTLTVTKEGGEIERWHTQQIVNYSALGNPYLQWPTRKGRS